MQSELERVFLPQSVQGMRLTPRPRRWVYRLSIKYLCGFCKGVQRFF